MEDSARVSLAAAVFAHAVAIHAPGADGTQLDAAVEGCNQALGVDRCASSAHAADAAWSATITWSDDAHRLAHVRLTRKGAEHLAPVTREVEFGGADPLEQRFRAVGLIVAAYVIASGRSGAVPSSEIPKEAAPIDPPPDPEPDRRLPPEAVASSEFDRAWGIDGGVLLGSSFRGVPLAWGGALKPWARLGDTRWLALGQLRLRRSEDTLRTDWLSGSLGMAVQMALPVASLGLELRSEAVVEYVALLAEDTTRSLRERAGLWRVGARAGADLLFGLAADWALFLGGDMQVAGPNLVVDVAGVPAGRESWLSVTGLVGLRFRAQ